MIVIASDRRETQVPPPHQVRGRDKLRNLTNEYTKNIYFYSKIWETVYSL